jgi:hypothetical protein
LTPINFEEPTIAQALADGTLLAIVDRLRAWRATTLRSS